MDINTSLAWPLCSSPILPDAPGLFSTVRKHDRHTGVDLYCEQNTEVCSLEDGNVVLIPWLTGKNASTKEGLPSSWWNDTKGIYIEGESGVINYGEVDPDHIYVKIGEKVKKGQVIAKVIRAVLRNNKGRPMVMLHLERYEKGFREEPVWWNIGEDKPKSLIDPLPLLQAASLSSFSKIPPNFCLEEYDGKKYIDPSAPIKESPYWKVWKKEESKI